MKYKNADPGFIEIQVNSEVQNAIYFWDNNYHYQTLKQRNKQNGSAKCDNNQQIWSFGTVEVKVCFQRCLLIKDDWLVTAQCDTLDRAEAQ